MNTRLNLRALFKLSDFACYIVLALIFGACHRTITTRDAGSDQAGASAENRALIFDSTSVAWQSTLNQKSAEGATADRFYKTNNFNTLWFGSSDPLPLYNSLKEVLRSAESYGLDTSDYCLPFSDRQIRNFYKVQQRDSLVIADIACTQRLFELLHNLEFGHSIKVGKGRNIWKRETKSSDHDVIRMLNEVKDEKELIALVNTVQPADPQYHALLKGLAYYQTLAAADPKEIIRVEKKLKPGDRHPALPLIRRKLALTFGTTYPLTEDSLSHQPDSLLYDSTLAEGVKRFQSLHGLEADGIIGEKSVTFLNQSFRYKADVIALNLERLRWRNVRKQERYIEVNIPEYQLRIVESGKVTMQMRVVVGEIAKATPVFQDTISHIVFAPTWTVPVSIIQEEIIPKLIKDSLAYSYKDYTFYKKGQIIDPATENWKTAKAADYKVVQDAGDDNALGKIKFVLRNKMKIYLHDTPSQRLFKKSYRALSHGCVRLDEPVDFAVKILNDENKWNAETIADATDSPEPKAVTLKYKWPVYIDYLTSWVDADGLVNFREDIYGHDAHQLDQLKNLLQ